MHLVHKSLSKVLSNRGDATAKADVFPARGVGGTLQCGVNAIRDEVECGTSAHRDRFASVMSQHEDGSVVRGIVAPPTFPEIVSPWSSDRPKHIAAQNPSSDVVKPPRSEFVVNPGRPAVTSKHLPKRTSGECPFVQSSTANAKWVVEVLVRAGAIAVKGYGEALDAELAHGL
jgi:hypothetical protein